MNRISTSIATPLAVATFVFAFSLPGAAQQSPNIEAQREAMKKLSFLAGHWSGPATIAPGPGEPLHLTQTENVEYKLDGLVLLIEGRSTGADGKAQFEALATIAYDDASKTTASAHTTAGAISTRNLQCNRMALPGDSMPARRRSATRCT